jgi:hypothetical protein
VCSCCVLASVCVLCKRVRASVTGGRGQRGEVRVLCTVASVAGGGICLSDRLAPHITVCINFWHSGFSNPILERLVKLNFFAFLNFLSRFFIIFTIKSETAVSGVTHQTNYK